MSARVHIQCLFWTWATMLCVFAVICVMDLPAWWFWPLSLGIGFSYGRIARKMESGQMGKKRRSSIS